MSLEGLLTYFGLIVAALTIMSPVQRRALGLFVPRRYLPLSIVTALIFLVVGDMPLGVPTPFGWRLELVKYFLSLGAFLVPVGAAVWTWRRWYEARLTVRSMAQLESFFEAALRENVFDEVERVLRKNRDSLISIPPAAASILFHPRMVEQLMDSHSMIHIELLAHIEFLKKLENRLQAVEVVVRKIVNVGASPLQSAVVARYGGIEHLQYAESERTIIRATFQNPEWYYEANAHYPLTITAVNLIEGGKLDDAYNAADENYISRQGVARRATCPIYLAIQGEVLALDAALDASAEKDFYVSDLFDILRNILPRSKFDPALTSVPGMQARYTPFSYLVEVITLDIEELLEKAVQKSVNNSSNAPNQACPGRVGMDLVRAWASCIWAVMDDAGRLDPVLRNRIVERYFIFLLALGWQPSEVLYGSMQNVSSLNHWRDVLVKELLTHFPSLHTEHLNTIKTVLRSLDRGKPFILNGYDWLKTQIPPHFLP